MSNALDRAFARLSDDDYTLFLKHVRLCVEQAERAPGVTPLWQRAWAEACTFAGTGNNDAVMLALFDWAREVRDRRATIALLEQILERS